MDITITFNCDNAAFEDDLEEALHFVLMNAKRKILANMKTKSDAKVLDSNGNSVGKVVFS